MNIDLVRLIITLAPRPPLPVTTILLDNTDMTVINSYVDVDWIPAATDYHSKNAFELVNGANLYLYGVTISEDEGGVDGIRDFIEIPMGADTMLDYMPVRVGADSEAYFYKWMDTQVVDRYGMGVEGATLTPEFHFPDPTVVATVTDMNDLSVTTDSAKARIMAYLGRIYGVTPATYDLTGLGGRAVMPLLTTFINSTNYPKGTHVGEYDVEANYGTHFGYTDCGFPLFPNIMEEDNLVSRQISLDGLMLPRDFSSPGLIVNATTGDMSLDGGLAESISISDFIIVEGGATLTISNAKLTMTYSDSVPYRIIVRDGGRLILNKVTMGAQAPLTISLYDTANLTVISSTVSSSIDILAGETSTVLLDKAVISGILGTAPNAGVRLWALSTQFDNGITSFTGTSVAHLTGCYSPSTAFRIMPSEQAEAYIYRWAEITVNGGLTPANPLPNANVAITSAYTEWGATLNRAGATDAAGVFRTALLSDYVFYDYTANPPAAVSKPYNIYSVAIQYQLDATTLNHQASVGLGLAAYPIMISQNATAKKTVTLTNVLPDLSSNISVAPLAANSTVGRGNEVQVSATVTNIGDATASGLVVWFQDVYQGTTITMYQEVSQTLAPLEQWNVTFPYTWIDADEVGLHNITVWVDPLNYIKEQNNNNDNNLDSMILCVTSQADLAILQYGDVWFSEANPLVGREFTMYANVRNIGDLDAANVLVSFYEAGSGILLGNTTIDSVAYGSLAVASIPVTYYVNATYSILVVIDGADSIQEVSEDNNDNSAFPRQLIVREFPDMAIIDFSIIEGTNLANIGIGLGTAITETHNRTMVTLRARIQNQGELYASGVYVEFYSGATYLGRSNTIASITSGSTAYAMLTWNAVTPLRQQTFNLRAIAYDSSGLGLVSNEAAQSLTVYDDRPDLELIDIELANNVTQLTDGNSFMLNVTFANNGISDAEAFSVEVYLSEDDYYQTKLSHASGNEAYQGLLSQAEVEILAAGDTVTLTMECTSVTEGLQYLFVYVDPELNSTDTIEYDGLTPLHGDIEEYDEMNNNGTLEVTVIMPELRIILQMPALGNNVFVEGEMETVFIMGLVVRVDNPSIGVPGINVTVTVGNNAPITVTSVAGGVFSTSVAVPAAGNYTIRASATDINEVQSWFRIDTPPSIPWWIIILIIVIVVAVIVGITLYLYFVGLGKTVQCGECSAFIPEGAAKCPKCGVEFETEVAKCSVCGAWVPIDVKNCPDCGTEFTVGTENLDDYEAKMKRQYEDVVRKFREEAKKELGQEFTETEFQAWWAKKPTFITFDLWLKEEEEMKRMGSRPCPVCQTENSVTAKICHKCGSVMGEPDMPKKPEAKQPPKQQPPAQPAAQPKPVQQQPPAQQAAAPRPAPAPQPAGQQPPAQQAAAPVPAAQQPAAAPVQAGKKSCPSCGTEVSAGEKTCPICSHDFGAEGDPARRIIRKPIKKIVRRPGEGGDQQQGQ